MRYPVVCCGWVVLAVGSSALLAQQATPQNEPTTAGLEQRVSELLKQLDAADATLRDQAEQTLVELGPIALTHLPETDDSTPAELKERLARVRQRLQQTATPPSLAPSRLTLQGEFTLAKLFAEIEKQTGNRVIDFRDRIGQPTAGGGPWQLDIDDQPFWPAFDRILDTVGLSVYRFVGEPRTLAVTSRDPGELPRAGRADYQGVFRIEATEVFAQRNLRNPGGSSLRARLEVLWEPRLTPVVVRHPMRLVEAVAENGEAVAVELPEATPELPVQPTVAGVDLVIGLRPPARTVQKLATLRGQFDAVVPGAVETFTFEKLSGARNVTVQKGGMTVVLDRVRKNGSVYELRIRLRPARSAVRFESHLNWAANNEVYLVDKQGNRIENPNYERFLEREQEIGFAYLFPVPGDIDDYRFIYRTPVSLVNQTVRYTLQNIPLP